MSLITGLIKQLFLKAQEWLRWHRALLCRQQKKMKQAALTDLWHNRNSYGSSVAFRNDFSAHKRQLKRKHRPSCLTERADNDLATRWRRALKNLSLRYAAL